MRPLDTAYIRAARREAGARKVASGSTPAPTVLVNGAIKLNCTVGNKVGWYGFTTANPSGKPAIIGGYPGDKPLQQWQSSDKVSRVSPWQIFYKNDTKGGMSGSGVWYDRDGPYITGIHAYGTHGIGNHRNYNHGTRITKAVFNNLKYWKNLP